MQTGRSFVRCPLDENRQTSPHGVAGPSRPVRECPPRPRGARLGVAIEKTDSGRRIPAVVVRSALRACGRLGRRGRRPLRDGRRRSGANGQAVRRDRRAGRLAAGRRRSPHRRRFPRRRAGAACAAPQEREPQGLRDHHGRSRQPLVREADRRTQRVPSAAGDRIVPPAGLEPERARTPAAGRRGAHEEGPAVGAVARHPQGQARRHRRQRHPPLGPQVEHGEARLDVVQPPVPDQPQGSTAGWWRARSAPTCAA